MIVHHQQCTSIRSKRFPDSRCPHRAVNSGLCKRHFSQKSPITLYYPQEEIIVCANTLDATDPMDPTKSVNDTDPISLDKICTIDPITQQKVINPDLDPTRLFTYTSTVGGKSYQRTILIDSIKALLDNGIRIDPFTNTPFQSHVVERARTMINQTSFAPVLSNHKELYQQDLIYIVDRFGELGYIINLDWLHNMRPYQYRQWVQELRHKWGYFRVRYPQLAPLVYPPMTLPLNFRPRLQIQSMTEILRQFSSYTLQGVELVLSSLAWVSRDVMVAYPDLSNS